MFTIEDMPFLEDGTPVEMVLVSGCSSSYGYRTDSLNSPRLGCSGLGKKISRMASDGQKYCVIIKHYGSKAHHAMIDAMNFDDLRTLYRRSSRYSRKPCI